MVAMCIAASVIQSNSIGIHRQKKLLPKFCKNWVGIKNRELFFYFHNFQKLARCYIHHIALFRSYSTDMMFIALVYIEHIYNNMLFNPCFLPKYHKRHDNAV